MKCNICKENTNVILSLANNSSVTSLGRIIMAETEVSLCPNCSHCQTKPAIDLFAYYSKEYKTLSSSADEDDLYEIKDERPVYRNEHMAKIFLKKLFELDKTTSENNVILDYGCGKSLVMKYFIEMTGNSHIYLYDVSQDYIKFWNSFLPNAQYSCFDLPEKWNEYFSVVTSFFSLEHVVHPGIELEKINRVLRPGGTVYLVVPNMYSMNTADMLVIDHVQHYSEPSMLFLLTSCGFEIIDIDHNSHLQASIYIAKKVDAKTLTTFIPNGVDYFINRGKEIALYWKLVTDSIRRFEEEMYENNINQYFIIGAGFLGSYINLQLRHPEYLCGYIDSNRFKQNKGWQNKKVYGPGIVAGNESIAIFSGLNLNQIKTVLPSIMPRGIPDKNLWTLDKVNF